MKSQTLKEKFSKLKRNKENTKALIVELMSISSIDFPIDHAMHKLYKYKFLPCSKPVFKWMMELCDDGLLIFNGYKPEKVNGRIVGLMPIFGLINKAKGE